MIYFSIIVPHKDIPDLLQRCLNSIPVRDDVQVIVVDDNSNPLKVDFAQFPRWEGKHYEIIYTKEGKGAGFARNIGLKHATGKWLLFADADDFFTGDFGNLMDEMVDAEEDLIFYDHRSVLSANPSVSAVRTQYASDYIAAYLNGDRYEGNLRCRYPIPSCKIVKKSLVDLNQIRFDETHWGNDIWFSAQVGCYARSLRVSPKVGYGLTVRDGSLISDLCGSQDELLDRVQESLKSERLFKVFGWGDVAKLSNLFLGIAYRKHGFWWCFAFCIKNLTRWHVFKSTGVFLAKRQLKH